MENTINQIRALLDDKNIRYLSIVHSPAYSEEEMAVNDYNLGHELVDSVLIRVNNKDTIMIIVPSTRKISLESLQREFNNTNLNFIGKKEMKRLFPEYEPGTMPPLGSLYNMQVYCVAEMQEMQEVTFYTGTRSYRIRMKMRDFLSIAQPKSFVSAATTSRYRAEINTVLPPNERQSFQKYEHCILGFSLENKNFATAKLVGMMDWVCRHFKNCTVLIGDSIHHHTLEIRGVDKNYAYDKALRLGREAIDTNNPIFQAHSDRCTIKVILCSQVQTTKAYEKYYQALKQLFDESEQFSECLRAFADTFAVRRHEPGSDAHELDIEKCCTYLLEELAIFACLSEQGCDVFVYPGALRALTEIVEGLHPGAPQALKDLVCVELKIKRCGAA